MLVNDNNEPSTTSSIALQRGVTDWQQNKKGLPSIKQQKHAVKMIE